MMTDAEFLRYFVIGLIALPASIIAVATIYGVILYARCPLEMKLREWFGKPRVDG